MRQAPSVLAGLPDFIAVVAWFGKSRRLASFLVYRCVIPSRERVYTEFMLKPSGELTDAGDGLFVDGTVYDAGNPEQELTPRPLRMVFVKDTPPARVLRQAAQAQRTLHAVGIPRINLARVVELTKSGSDRRSAIHFPYEMIIVAVLP